MTLTAISPIDGRYHNLTSALSAYFSEEALIKYRIKVEIEYFIALCKELPQLQPLLQKASVLTELRKIYTHFSTQNAQEVKTIEQTTSHDVKAVEYFIKQRFDVLGLSAYKEYIHFGLTSQDINNTAIPLSLKDAINECYLPTLEDVLGVLAELSATWSEVPMLARTHGQPASPTRLGKELQVFVVRLEAQLKQLKNVPYSAKFGGATGNFNAHFVAFPQVNWRAFAHVFVEDILGLSHSFPTTQIEHYDNLAALFDALKRINTILIDLCRDVWQYISMEYFKQRIKEGEVGSSAMPHKVNPIDFENAEGNFGIANAIFEHLAAKLPISRLQRDLTDSTVLRNIGVPLAHTFIALKAVLKGLDKLIINEEKIAFDLQENTVVIAEAIQTILRREGYPDPYEALKTLTRTGDRVTLSTIHQFVQSLTVSDAIKAELLAVTPENYTGIPTHIESSICKMYPDGGQVCL